MTRCYRITQKKVLKGSSGVELVTHQATDGKLLGARMVAISRAVLELDHPALKRRISAYISRSVTASRFANRAFA